MKFSVGYQIRDDDTLVEAILKNRDKIGELYFSWADFPNGRSMASSSAYNPYEAEKKQAADFERLKKSGIKFNLLLNGNCYGKYAQSRSFFCKIGETADYLKETYGLSSVTTTSPLIAKFFKSNFSELEIRASVNMEIGTAEGMDYLSELFDGFYLKREYNRSLEKITAARGWCDKNSKKLYCLANSGCLNFCSAHVFHDNLVSHENEISEMDNAYAFVGQCREYLQNAEKRSGWLRLTNFIRPEDMSLYERYFDGIKLATRVNSNPAGVINAYCKGAYSGSVVALLEPNHSDLFYPAIIENKKIPDNFAKTVLTCDKSCDKCGYCFEALKSATVILQQ